MLLGFQFPLNFRSLAFIVPVKIPVWFLVKTNLNMVLKYEGGHKDLKWPFLKKRKWLKDLHYLISGLDIKLQ